MSKGFAPGAGSSSLKARSMADLQVSLKRSSVSPLLVCTNPEQKQQQQQQQHHREQQQQQQQQLLPHNKVDFSNHPEAMKAMKFGVEALWPAMEDVMEELMIEELPSRTMFVEAMPEEEVEVVSLGDTLSRTFRGLKFKVKVGNASLRRLLSGAIAGAVSRTAVAPLETIRTHLMVGNAGKSVTGVFNHIMEHEGWQGLFRGNGINVIRVTPSKAIELFAYDSVKNALTPKEGETSRLPLPVPTIAGAAAGVCSTLCTYPLELLKTRMTVQKSAYDNLLDAFVKIIREEGPLELYRGLVPSVVGIIPYCGINYFAYESLKKAYKKIKKQDRVGHLGTLLIGSTAGIISSTATYPLEVARKQMQMGALNGVVYDHLFHALQGIVEREGAVGLYRGLGASCLKLVPAAGISFMCYEACKKILAEDEQVRAAAPT